MNRLLKLDPGNTELVAQKQKITDSNGEDKDIIALALEEHDAVVQVFLCAMAN